MIFFAVLTQKSPSFLVVLPLPPGTMVVEVLTRQTQCSGILELYPSSPGAELSVGLGLHWGCRLHPALASLLSTVAALHQSTHLEGKRDKNIWV